MWRTLHRAPLRPPAREAKGKHCAGHRRRGRYGLGPVRPSATAAARLNPGAAPQILGYPAELLDDQGAEVDVRKIDCRKKRFGPDPISNWRWQALAYGPVSTQIRGGKLHPGRELGLDAPNAASVGSPPVDRTFRKSPTTLPRISHVFCPDGVQARVFRLERMWSALANKRFTVASSSMSATTMSPFPAVNCLRTTTKSPSKIHPASIMSSPAPQHEHFLVVVGEIFGHGEEILDVLDGEDGLARRHLPDDGHVDDLFPHDVAVDQLDGPGLRGIPPDIALFLQFAQVAVDGGARAQTHRLPDLPHGRGVSPGQHFPLDVA